jgi:hypothetical protein
MLRLSTPKTVFIALALTFVTPALVFSQGAAEGAATLDFSWQKEVEGFGARLVLSRQPDRFLAAWGAAPSSEERRAIHNTEQAARGEPVVAFLLFTGCLHRATGLCDSTVSFTVLRPDGSVFASLELADLWKDKEVPPSQRPQLGATSLGVVVDGEDPLGVYTILARVCDAVAGWCLDLEQVLEVVEPELALDLNEFLHRYYRDPRPLLIEAAMRSLSAKGFLADANLRPPIIGFFALVFAQNLDFLPRWAGVIASLEPSTRESLRAAIALSKSPSSLISEEAPSPYRNDMLWGAFFATGDVAYVHAVVDRMKYLGEREDLNLFLTASSAQWSLCSNAKSHAAVAKILQNFHASGDRWRQEIDDALTKTPDEIRRAMNEVLRLQEEQGVW